MITRTITYIDYDGVERTEDFYFNLTQAELLELKLSHNGGLEKKIDRITKIKDTKEMIKMFKEIIALSYGVKSDDGRRLIKNEDVLNEFIETEAYSTLFMELATNDVKAAEFITGLVPASMQNDLKEELIKTKELALASNELNQEVVE